MDASSLTAVSHNLNVSFNKDIDSGKFFEEEDFEEGKGQYVLSEVWNCIAKFYDIQDNTAIEEFRT